MRFTKPTSNQKAYLGKHALDLVRITSDQVAVVYEHRGIIIPVELSSTLHCLSYRNPATLSVLSGSLQLPHQLVAQRVRKLIDLGLVNRYPDPDDRRRYSLKLTEAGKDQAQRLRACMRDMAQVYDALYAEIGCDLPSMMQAAMTAVQTRPLHERFLDMGLAGEEDTADKLPKGASIYE